MDFLLALTIATRHATRAALLVVGAMLVSGATMVSILLWALSVTP